MKYRTKQKIRYLLKARHRKGHGIHSPFLFRLITEVIEDKGKFPAYPLLAAANENVRNMLKIIDMRNYLSELTWKGKVDLINIKKLYQLPERFDRLLFRLINDFKPRRISYFGSSFGVTLLALALADSRIHVEALVTDDYYRMFCQRLVDVYEIKNIRLKNSKEIVVSDFVVIQNPLAPQYCDLLFEKILKDQDYNGLLVFCGLHTSPELEAVWNRHKANPTVRITLDLFEIGLLICRKGLQKEEFVLRF